VACFSVLTAIFAFSTPSLMPALASLSCALAIRGSFAHFQMIAMAHVRSTAQYVGGAVSGGSGGEGGGSEERMESARLSDAGSRSEAGDVSDEGSRSQSFYFGPSTVTVSQIRGMIDNGYFDESMGREPGEETVPKPNANEVVVFEEFLLPI
jgi:hypothetical protein